MDTRRKIVSAADAARDPGQVVVRGYFDPLCVSAVRRLEQLACGDASLTILLAPPVQPLLPDSARADLLAGLHAVRNVVVTDGTIPAEFVEASIVDETEGDLQRTRELMEHVRRRQNAQ